jgi:glycosyltransferase involved in cell wall biosynthesis
MTDLSRLSIAFLTGALGQGGAERQLFYLLRALKEGGARIQLFSLTDGEFWEGPLAALGVPVMWIGRRQSRVARLATLIAELRHDRPAIIQSQHLFTNIYVATAARTLGLREIGAVRNDPVREAGSVGRIMGNLSVRMPRALAINSRAGIGRAIEMGAPAERLHLLPNVVDTDFFTPSPRGEEGEVTIAAVGRLVKQKRFDRLISILARVRAQTDRPFKAVIAGDGPLRSDLERQAMELGLRQLVRFKGPVADARAVYHEAEVVVLTSDWEGAPNVALEAMACGLPVVATAVGDVPELIGEGETGFLARPEDEEKWVAALLRLLHNPSLRVDFGRRARQLVVAEHSPRQLPQRLLNLYEAVLA